MNLADLQLVSLIPALGSAVVHFLWQGALLGLVCAVLLRVMRTARARYALTSGALFLCLLSFLGTFFAALAAPSVPVDGGGAVGEVAGWSARAPELLGTRAATEIAAWCWAVGVLVMTSRSALHGLGARRLRRAAVAPVEERWERVFRSLKRELGVDHAVRLLQSGLAQVPMVVGWFRPVVLVPVSVFTSLTPDQLRALLAHELAHVRRLDPLLNAVQAAIEIVLFFHPAVWWISRQVRVEREYCCDDSSVRVTGSPKRLAEALAALEALRLTHQPSNQAVLAASGGPLMQRIERILGTRPDGPTSLTGWQLPAGLALAAFLALAGNAWAAPSASLDGERAQHTDRHERHEGTGAHAEDFAAFEARIKAAVEAGKMTPAEAKEALAGYKARLAYAQAEHELQELVKAGKITPEQAAERLEAHRMHLEYGKVERELQELVKAGKITPEQAQERLEGLRRRMGEHRGRDEDHTAVIRRIEAAVEAGELTPAEGKARIAEYQQRLKEKRAMEDPESAIRAIQAAVEAGKLTPAEGKAKIAGIRERSAIADRKRAEHEAVIAEIHAAVVAGKLTPEEAERKMRGLREHHERLHGHERTRHHERDGDHGRHGDHGHTERSDHHGQEAHLEGVERRIRQAVETGRLTPEEGQARLAEYRKQVAEKKAQEQAEQEAKDKQKQKDKAKQKDKTKEKKPRR